MTNSYVAQYKGTKQEKIETMTVRMKAIKVEIKALNEEYDELKTFVFENIEIDPGGTKEITGVKFSIQRQIPKDLTDEDSKPIRDDVGDEVFKKLFYREVKWKPQRGFSDLYDKLEKEISKKLDKLLPWKNQTKTVS